MQKLVIGEKAMSDAPETIWAVADIDVSAQTCDIYAQSTPEGFVEKPTQYTRTDTIPSPMDMSDALIRAALEAAAETCTTIIRDYDVMDSTGTKHLPVKTQTAAKGMVSLARQDIRALADDPEAIARIIQSAKDVKAAEERNV